MNISTGGPHILLFERDQRLAALLTSELQLAGYECHIARTAVEVFDAIARFPVRLVLVNLAQAAASRREFWVALDTQRRGSGIQVFTFHCSNLAGYGPRDPDDYSQASMADMEIDGMLGLMKLVDTIRARVPGPEGNATTAPRIPRTPASPTLRQDIETMQRSTMSPLGMQQPAQAELQANDNRPSGVVRQRMGSQSVAQPPINTTSTPTMPTPREAQGISQPYSTTSPATQLPGGSQVTYSDKIRAVLYPNPHSPNPHSWGSAGNTSWNTSHLESDAPPTGGAARSYAPQGPGPASSSGISMLQRLANGQIYSSPGLAELSRLVQGHHPPAPAREDFSNQRVAHESWRTEGIHPSPNISAQAGPLLPAYTTPDQQSIRSNDHLPLPPNPMAPLPTQAEMNVTHLSRGRDYQPYPAQIEVAGSRAPSGGSLQDRDYQLRAAPIQDLPLQRSVGNQPSPGYGAPAVPPPGVKPPDGVLYTKEALSRPIQQQSASQPLQPPLASTGSGPTTWPPSPTVRNAVPSAPDREIEPATAASREKDIVPSPTESPYYREDSEPPRRSDRSQDFSYQRDSFELPRRSGRSQDLSYQRDSSEPSRRSNHPEVPHNLREDTELPGRSDHLEMPLYQEAHSKEIEESIDARNAVILDILQSLPAVATPSGQQEQAVQTQVHNGRATRSLGNVLLDGHLVPQDRLEVAQNIQRMLRGVDLNYQLGEILLMFKLLTPDQLLAATLVGYGLITRIQISALGRIRQELHAIGLEYDLENLVILFRILTPEQLREARSSVLG